MREGIRMASVAERRVWGRQSLMLLGVAGRAVRHSDALSIRLDLANLSVGMKLRSWCNGLPPGMMVGRELDSERAKNVILSLSCVASHESQHSSTLIQPDVCCTLDSRISQRGGPQLRRRWTYKKTSFYPWQRTKYSSC